MKLMLKKQKKFYLKNNICLSLTVLYKIYRAFREVIYKYLLIVCQSEELGVEEEHGIFAVDESLFNHININQIWVLGIINKSSKSFRLETTLDRSEQTLKKFVENYVKGGNSIVSDDWRGYYFLNHEDSNYEHIITSHLIGNFGAGLRSSSHIEAIWNVLKSKIKSTYHVIPHKNFLHFLREAEFKYIIRNKKYNERIKEFLECCKLINDVADSKIFDTEFLKDSDISDDD